jgi:FAD synthase
MSAAHMLEKSEINTRLSKLTMRIKDLKQKGLKQMLIDKEDTKLRQILQEQFSSRKDYLKSVVPILVKKTRDNHHFGNLHSRVERGRAYLDRL